MKKIYIVPAVEHVACCTENMMALSLLGGKADGSEVLSNGRFDLEWEEEDEEEER